jgi:hypothetical protein
MVFSSSTADFGFKIDFARNTEDPARIFRALSELIKFCEVTDKALIKSLDIDVEYKLILDDIEEGSLIVWLKYNFEPDFRLVNLYLVKAKSRIIKWIEGKDTINTLSELADVVEEIQDDAKETKTNPLNIYHPLNNKIVLLIVDSLQSPTSHLQEWDELFYLTGESKLPVNRNFAISKEKQDKLLVEAENTYESELTLEVKKPDYLGESKWQFKLDNRIVDVKINDLDWLKSFQNREFEVHPGDSVKAKVEVISKSYFSQKTKYEYVLKEVIEVISRSHTQLSLFEDKEKH